MANRADWLEDPVYWQGVTRAIEDRLSDALLGTRGVFHRLRIGGFESLPQASAACTSLGISVTDMESMPHSTRKRAKLGLSLGPCPHRPTLR